MSLHHAASGEVISVQPYGQKLSEARPHALLKSSQLEVMRLVLPAGRTVPEHWVGGELTFQCIEGKVELQAYGKTIGLGAGEMVHLEGGVHYAVRAVEDASLLMTVVLTQDSTRERRTE